jgi:hypothetical protein
MSSTNQLHPQESSVADAISRAFDAVWATLSANLPPEIDQAEELRIRISQTLISLASDGITDWQELRSKALQCMAPALRSGNYSSVRF